MDFSYGFLKWTVNGTLPRFLHTISYHHLPAQEVFEGGHPIIAFRMEFHWWMNGGLGFSN